MEFKKVNIVLITAVAVFLSIVLVFFGNYIIFNLFYVFVFLIIVLRRVLKGGNLSNRVYATVIFAAIMVIEIVFNTLVIFDPENPSGYLLFGKIIGTIMVFIPFVAEHFVIVSKNDFYDFPTIADSNALSYSDYLNYGNDISKNLKTIKQEKEKITYDDIVNIITDLPKHSSFKYINKDSITDEYFTKANETLDDENIYLVLSNTGSSASKVISAFTRKIYNHISISFDHDLETIISYNGGENLYPPGLNPEMIEWFNKKNDSSIIVYKLELKKDDKQLLINRVRDINRAGSAYNMLGLILKLSVKPNILFCSQFIYKLLESAGLNYFTKEDGQVKPTDFVELDYYRKLKFSYEIKFNKSENEN